MGKSPNFMIGWCCTFSCLAHLKWLSAQPLSAQKNDIWKDQDISYVPPNAKCLYWSRWRTVHSQTGSLQGYGVRLEESRCLCHSQKVNWKSCWCHGLYKLSIFIFLGNFVWYIFHCFWNTQIPSCTLFTESFTHPNIVYSVRILLPIVIKNSYLSVNCLRQGISKKDTLKYFIFI